MRTTIANVIDILIVEDNAGDARLIREILNDDKLSGSLSLAKDGVEAMDFLRKKGKFRSVPTPDLIILDLNLPRKDGREVLAEIKNDEELKHIPIVIMTISQAEEDILRSYNLYANCYITKSLDLNQFTRAVKSIEDFWFSIVKLPPKMDNLNKTPDWINIPGKKRMFDKK
ncbi:MAG: response regulator [Bacteroidales bacterium]|nr:response regulator [Bacteroidales bacterium]